MPGQQKARTDKPSAPASPPPASPVPPVPSDDEEIDLTDAASSGTGDDASDSGSDNGSDDNEWSEEDFNNAIDARLAEHLDKMRAEHEAALQAVQDASGAELTKLRSQLAEMRQARPLEAMTMQELMTPLAGSVVGQLPETRVRVYTHPKTGTVTEIMTLASAPDDDTTSDAVNVDRQNPET